MSPARTIRLLVAAAICSGLALAALSFDIAIASWLRDHRLPGDLRRLISVSEVFAFGVSVFLLAVTAATLDPRGIRCGAYLLTSSLGAGILADGLKLLVPRQRPSALIPGEITESFAAYSETVTATTGHGWQSFPSGHTATAVGFACALAVCYPRGRWLFALFAVLAAVQRMESQSHYLSDVLAGTAVGLLWVACNDRWPAWRSLFTAAGNPPTASL